MWRIQPLCHLSGRDLTRAGGERIGRGRYGPCGVQASPAWPWTMVGAPSQRLGELFVKWAAILPH